MNHRWIKRENGNDWKICKHCGVKKKTWDKNTVFGDGIHDEIWYYAANGPFIGKNPPECLQQSKEKPES